MAQWFRVLLLQMTQMAFPVSMSGRYQQPVILAPKDSTPGLLSTCTNMYINHTQTQYGVSVSRQCGMIDKIICILAP